MRRIVYGLGGYDPSKPNDNIVEDYDDGVELPEPSVEVPQSAIDGLTSSITDTATTSELKSALQNFVDSIN